jgi:hypothetical protein
MARSRKRASRGARKAKKAEEKRAEEQNYKKIVSDDEAETSDKKK